MDKLADVAWKVGSVLLGAAGLVGLVALVWYSPVWLLQWVGPSEPTAVSAVEAGSLTLEAYEGIRADARLLVLQTIGGLAVLYGLLVNAQRLREARRTNEIAEEGQVTERFTRAIDQLGSDQLTVRLGGIYALERISRDSVQDWGPVMEVLTIHLRTQRPRRDPLPTDTDPFPEEFQAILDVLGRSQRPSQRLEPFNLLRTDLRGARIQGSGWAGVQGAEGTRPGVLLQAADLRGATLVEAHLEGATLVEAHLEGAYLLGAYLKGAHLERAYLRGTNLRGAHLEAAHLERAHLVDAHLERAHLMDVHLERATLRGAHLEGAHLERAHLIDVHLERARLVEAHLEGATLWRSHLERARLEKAYLEEAQLMNAHLEGATLAGAHLMGAHLEEANLAKANLAGANLAEAHLEGTNLAGANLAGANLTQEQLSVTRGTPATLPHRSVPPDAPAPHFAGAE